MHADPVQRARKLERGRAWRKANPDKVKQGKRRFLLREGKARQNYLKLQARHNRNPVRAQKKRELARARYYELHPKRPDCLCRGCGERVDWNGVGRPVLRCDRCCAPAELRRRERRRTQRAPEAQLQGVA